MGTWNSLPKLEGESWIDWWCAAIIQYTNFLHSFGKRIDWQHKHKEIYLWDRFARDKKFLNDDLCKINIQTSIAAIEAHLRKIDNHKRQVDKVIARLHWLKEGNKGTKYFFSHLNSKHKKERLRAIKDELDTL